VDYVCPSSRARPVIYCAFPLAQYRTYKEEILTAIKRVLDRGEYVLGPEVSAFEKAFAAYCDADYAVGLNSGTDALVLALDVGPGDEVVTVSHTALATVSAIIAAGATPILIDVDPTYYTLDPERLRGAITPKTKAVIPVHLYGQPADMDAIMKTAREFGVAVIEDCAQAAGAIYKGRRVGGIGDIGCFSFYPTKNLGAIGDGGLVVTRTASLAERVRRLRQYGWDENRTTEEPGLNSRLDEIQAAILGVKLKYLDGNNKRRRDVARLYDKTLKGLPIVLPAERPDVTHVYHLYVIACENRDLLRRRLAEGGVLAGVHYAVPAHLHGGYERRCKVPLGRLAVTERLAQTILSLPVYPELSESQVNLVRSFLE
jgi:dTDP-4-amino-4,6-dideoxygalactose transaminase